MLGTQARNRQGLAWTGAWGSNTKAREEYPKFGEQRIRIPRPGRWPVGGRQGQAQAHWLEQQSPAFRTLWVHLWLASLSVISDNHPPSPPPAAVPPRLADGLDEFGDSEQSPCGNSEEAPGERSNLPLAQDLPPGLPLQQKQGRGRHVGRAEASPIHVTS